MSDKILDRSGSNRNGLPRLKTDLIISVAYLVRLGSANGGLGRAAGLAAIEQEYDGTLTAGNKVFLRSLLEGSVDLDAVRAYLTLHELGVSGARAKLEALIGVEA